MNETASRPPEPAVGTHTLSAGALLRQARQAQGLHIVALAAAMKVAPRKLELLEADRYDELLDSTFARALAQAVCRSLKIDAAPILARLPSAEVHGLDRAAATVYTSFREHSPRADAAFSSALRNPAVWGPVLILAGALLVWLLPKGLWSPGRAGAGPQASASAVAASGAAETASETLSAGQSPAPVVEPVLPKPTTAPAATGLVLRATGESWVEVTDANGQSLLARLLARGETVALDGTTPLRVTLGNANNMQLSFRGQRVDLPATRDNVARIELK